MIQSFDNAENEMLSAMMDKQKCDMFDPNMYHDALTLQFKQKQFADGYQEVISRCEKVERVLDNSERELEEKKRELEEKKRELEEKKQEIIFQNSRIVKTENEIKNLKQTICNKEGHIEQLLEVEREYEREKNSRTYRMALTFRKISTFFFPVDSKRRFFARLIGKGMRHPILMLKMINVRRIKNCFTILRTEDAASALNHFRLVEEYEKSRDIPVENVDIVPVTENKKTIEEYEVLHFKQYEKPLVSIYI